MYVCVMSFYAGGWNNVRTFATALLMPSARRQCAPPATALPPPAPAPAYIHAASSAHNGQRERTQQNTVLMTQLCTTGNIWPGSDIDAAVL